jgi:CHAT domain-containing protein/Tfp pilus assembly protein PilF
VKKMRMKHAIGVGLCLFLLITNNDIEATEAYAGSIVESTAPYFAAERGGLQLGDRITGWANSEFPDVVMPLEGAFALRLLEREVHPVQPVTLHGWRGSNRIALTPGHGRWRLGSRPAWPADVAERYTDVLKTVEHDPDGAEPAAVAFGNSLLAAGDIEGAAWFWFSFAGAVSSNGQWQTAEEFFGNALTVLSDNTVDEEKFADQRGLLHYFLASAQVRQNLFSEAVNNYEQALAIESAISSESLAIAANQVGLGQIARRQSDLPKAQTLFEEALWLQRRLAPTSLVVASTLQNLARVQLDRSELDAASASYSGAYQIADQRDPGGVAAAGYLNGLGIVKYLQGNMAAAEDHWTRSLEMKQRMEPGSRNVSSVMHNVGLVNRERGDLREAENYYRRALAIAEKIEPGSLSTARTMNNLGTLALEQGDVRNAEYFHQRAYALRKDAVPDSIELAVSLVNLGNVARESEDFDKAIRFHEQALAIQQRAAPQTTEHARIIANLGATARQQGQSQLARRYFEDALKIHESIAPNSGDVADILTRLGEVLLQDAESEKASILFSRASDIFARIAPETFRSARTWHGMAIAAQQLGRIADARSHFDEALLALESQQLKLGGSEESRARVKARYAKIYKDYIQFLLDNSEQEAAFEVLERSRARELSNMLAERDLVFAEDIPAELDLRRRTLARRYEGKQSALYGAVETAQQDALRTELLAIRREQDAVQRAIRDAAPGLTELQYPRNRTFGDYRSAMPEGTAIVSFSVDESHSDVFVIDVNGQLTVTRLDTSKAELADEVTRFRFLMDAGRWDDEPGQALLEHAESLYQLLLEPLEASIQSADLLLIVPDGSLNVLPFAALRRRATDDSQYVAEWKPSLIVNSLSIYSQLENRLTVSASIGDRELVAFGNPDYPNINDDSPARLLRDGYDVTDLRTLPWTATEVRNIAAAYPDKHVVYTGAEATEERAKAVTKGTAFLHFATHATLNERHPLDAALVLSVPRESDASRDNGFLHVWEIYEDLRLDAELVTLSGCETALGSDYPGEGLIGLTRAFHYAGASAVLASLWSVDDRSTSDLMTHFYLAVGQEDSLALALQSAQMAMIHDEDPITPTFAERIKRWIGIGDESASRRHPYHWAGFVLNGRGEMRRSR